MLRATLLCCFAMTNLALADHHEAKQYIELRYYNTKSQEAAEQVDQYLIQALVPALNRAGSKTVGVFREEQEPAQPMRLVVIAHDSISDFAALGKKLAADKTYQSAADEFLSQNKQDSPLLRIRSELLHSFDCWPKLKRPQQSEQDGRIFELRIYESASEKFGNLKVEMFNAGEVPIFLDSGITPVFMGQALAGDLMPNLTYLTVYQDQAAKDQGWANFRKHPDWKVLSAEKKYKGSVSKIHKINLVPVAGSQL